ncbi:hypothetical protein H072_10793 [Dactylellina haptotyla CBS 200.50]|uniref:Uncharacterized protein n=1 Tax=Dactylellina haptotyla (strain CBS 200.50) TaxID=1284197 RepID=S8A3T2_DACHA|nr:hypothetical protein H072_10793 [Dactylellina haptotyla CBS 200.50]
MYSRLRPLLRISRYRKIDNIRRFVTPAMLGSAVTTAAAADTANNNAGNTTRQRIRHLVVDFDQTLTVRDTLSTLASASPLPDAANVFEYLTNAYVEDYIAYAASFGERNTLASELEFLYGLREVERRSIHRIEASGIFKGITREDLVRAARRVGVRYGGEFRALVREVFERGGRVSVVSVNWSGGFIREVLRSISTNVDRGSRIAAAAAGEEDMERVEIYANNLVTDDNGVSTGRLDRRFTASATLSTCYGRGGGAGDESDNNGVRNENDDGVRWREGGHGMWTAEDKMRILDDILEGPASGAEGVEYADGSSCSPTNPTLTPTEKEKDQKEQDEDKEEREGFNVYVGDSPTDFAALLFHRQVARGFVMGGEGENRSLLDICQRHGVRVVSRVREEKESGSRSSSRQGRGNKHNKGGSGTADKGDTEGPDETGAGQSEKQQREGDNSNKMMYQGRPLYRVERWSELLESLRRPDRWQ